MTSGPPALDETSACKRSLLCAAEKQKERYGVAFRSINRQRLRGLHITCSPGGLSITLALLPLLVSGCSRAPSFDIVGSFFPAWLVCLVIGILLTALARWLLLRRQIVVVWPILVYPSLAAMFTFLFWLLFFS